MKYYKYCPRCRIRLKARVPEIPIQRYSDMKMTNKAWEAYVDRRHSQLAVIYHKQAIWVCPTPECTYCE